MNNDLPLSMYVSNLWLPHVAMAERLAFWEEPKRWLNQTRARDTFCLKFSNKIRMLDFKGEFVGGIENSILIKKLYITAPTLGKHSLTPGIVTYPVKTRYLHVWLIKVVHWSSDLDNAREVCGGSQEVIHTSLHCSDTGEWWRIGLYTDT